MKFADRKFERGLVWLAIGVAGALLYGHAGELGLNEYTQRWLGACLKVTTGAWGGYRISRDIACIDPSSTQYSGLPVNPMAFAVLHLARALIIAAAILGVCLAV
ncbi:hypothetical protein [Dokdonella soli]|uniref:Uncharacterized protein n=1 Tax=Dokdonella soli TaxID=529810 RepID=A0ABN1IUP5_9GAMM